MRWAFVALLALGCDGDASSAAPDSRFRPIGGKDVGVTADAGVARRLALRFERIEQDSGALRVVDFVFLGDDELILLDKDGAVHHMAFDGEKATRVGGFELEEVWFDSDAGLISVALDPDFATNRFIYLGFTTDIETSVIRRYTWDAEDYEATKASGQTIIEVRGEGSRRSWHNVGSIGFTEEGYLWGLFGDKTLDEPALDPSSTLGSLIRVIPNRVEGEGGYTTPDDNPFADGTGHPAVYAKGMRSPWKGVYRDGRWIFGDIGLDDWEEVNLVDAPGQSFGWPAAEGVCTRDCEGFVDPWMFYGRGFQQPYIIEDPDSTSSRLRSVWVGVAYEPNANDPYQGLFDDVLVFGDFFMGFVRGRRMDGEGQSWPVGHLWQATAWRQGPDGYVYASTMGTWPTDRTPVQPSPLYRAVLAK